MTEMAIKLYENNVLQPFVNNRSVPLPLLDQDTILSQRWRDPHVMFAFEAGA